jgi:branched-chain amino acid aminotransferase
VGLFDSVLGQSFDGDALLAMIKKLIVLDRLWIPSEPGHSLYVRPVMSPFLSPFSFILPRVKWSVIVATQAAIGVSPPTEALLFVICSPVGPYYTSGFKPVALYGTTDKEYIRAAPGGWYCAAVVWLGLTVMSRYRHWRI